MLYLVSTLIEIDNADYGVVTLSSVFKYLRVSNLNLKIQIHISFSFSSIFNPSDEQQTNNLCEQIFDSTNCAPQTKYAYDKTQKKCVEFTFNGCLGNRNNYDTMTDCEARHSKWCYFYSFEFLMLYISKIISIKKNSHFCRGIFSLLVSWEIDWFFPIIISLAPKFPFKHNSQ